MIETLGAALQGQPGGSFGIANSNAVAPFLLASLGRLGKDSELLRSGSDKCVWRAWHTGEDPIASEVGLTMPVSMINKGGVARTCAAATAALLLCFSVFVSAASASAEDSNASDLTAAAQNPIADMISLPLHNNTFFSVTKGNKTANERNIQPLYDQCRLLR